MVLNTGYIHMDYILDNDFHLNMHYYRFFPERVLRSDLTTDYFSYILIVLSFLQPENILLKNDDKFPEIRLIDFGLSRRVDLPYSQYDIVGTPEYVGM